MRVFDTYKDLGDAVRLSTFLFKPEFGPAAYRCAVCEQTKPLSTSTGGGGTGYGLDEISGTMSFVCYECCGEREKQLLLKNGKGYLYYDDRKHTVTNWPGTLAMPARAETGTRTVARFSFMLPGDNTRWLGSMSLSDTAGNIARVWRSKR